jgi:hypothetical protein
MEQKSEGEIRMKRKDRKENDSAVKEVIIHPDITRK